MSEIPPPQYGEPRKSPGLAGFLEYIFPGAGFLYCDQIRKGGWILIGTIVANFVIFAPIIAPAFLPQDVFEAVYTPIGSLVRDFVTTLFFIGFFGNAIWLIVRIIWVANVASAHNKGQDAIIKALTSPSAKSPIP